MSMDTSLMVRSHEENWLPILELAVEEVFEIMLGSRVKPVPKSEHPTAPGGFTAMVGLAGRLCGILTFSSDRDAARELAKCMLGPEIADSEEQVSDALGEICNMIAGNFKNKLSRHRRTLHAERADRHQGRRIHASVPWPMANAWKRSCCSGTHRSQITLQLHS